MPRAYWLPGSAPARKGNELWGEVCTQNRGVMRFEMVASGSRGHAFAVAARRPRRWRPDRTPVPGAPGRSGNAQRLLTLT